MAGPTFQHAPFRSQDPEEAGPAGRPVAHGRHDSGASAAGRRGHGLPGCRWQGPSTKPPTGEGAGRRGPSWQRAAARLAPESSGSSSSTAWQSSVPAASQSPSISKKWGHPIPAATRDNAVRAPHCQEVPSPPLPAGCCPSGAGAAGAAWCRGPRGAPWSRSPRTQQRGLWDPDTHRTRRVPHHPLRIVPAPCTTHPGSPDILYGPHRSKGVLIARQLLWLQSYYLIFCSCSPAGWFFWKLCRASPAAKSGGALLLVQVQLQATTSGLPLCSSAPAWLPRSGDQGPLRL